MPCRYKALLLSKQKGSEKKWVDYSNGTCGSVLVTISSREITVVLTQLIELDCLGQQMICYTKIYENKCSLLINIMVLYINICL